MTRVELMRLMHAELCAMAGFSPKSRGIVRTRDELKLHYQRYHKEYYTRTRNDFLAKCRERYAADRVRYLERAKRYRNSNKDKIRQRKRLAASTNVLRTYFHGFLVAKLYSEDLADCYVRNNLYNLGYPNPSRDQIEQKRLVLKIKRKANEIKRELNAW